MQTFLIISFLTAISGVFAQSDYCLECICGVESGNATYPGCGVIDESCGDPGQDPVYGCRRDYVDNACMCGPYDIKYNYYIDCAGYLGWPLGNTAFHLCATDEECSRECIRGYMQRYGNYCTGGIPYPLITCDRFAGIHHSGLSGCNITSTYRAQVRVCCGRSEDEC